MHNKTINDVFADDIEDCEASDCVMRNSLASADNANVDLIILDIKVNLIQ